MEPKPANRPALLITHDLIFSTKILGTARQLGYPMQCMNSADQVEAFLAGSPSAFVLVDLTTQPVAGTELISKYRSLLGSDGKLVGFGPHVETQLLQSALDSGCHEVMPRSKLNRILVELIKDELQLPGLDSNQN